MHLHRPRHHCQVRGKEEEGQGQGDRGQVELTTGISSKFQIKSYALLGNLSVMFISVNVKITHDAL